MSVAEAEAFFGDGEARMPAAHKILERLADVGLGYLTIGQPLTTLSGGERQRLKLATHMGEKGGVYVLDEPTTGLHLADVEQLLGLLDRLVDSGKSVIVIEHHQAVMAHADWIIDLGPGAGHDGGRIVFEGTPADLVAGALHAHRRAPRGLRRRDLTARPRRGTISAGDQQTRRDAAPARPRAAAPRPRPDRPGVRAAAGRRGARPRRAHVGRAPQPPVPARLRRVAVQLPDDAAHRARDGAAAPRRPQRHRGLLRGRLLVAGHLQHALHRAGRRAAQRLPARGGAARRRGCRRAWRSR